MNTLKLDPAAMAAYTTIADTVSQQLASAASVAEGAVNQEKLSADLGMLGADFAARFTAAVSEHAQALSTAGRLVSTYGQVLRGLDTSVRHSESEAAAGMAKTGADLAQSGEVQA